MLAKDTTTSIGAKRNKSMSGRKGRSVSDKEFLRSLKDPKRPKIKPTHNSPKRVRALLDKITSKYRRKPRVLIEGDLPWRYVAASRSRRKYYNFPKKRGRRRRKPRRRFTLKERPLLNLFLLHAPWRRERYRLRTNSARLYSHAQAFCMYYGVKEGPCVRMVQNIKRQPARVKLLFERFERRIDVTLVRLGWAGSFKIAHELLATGKVRVVRGSHKGASFVAQGSDRLNPGDRLSVGTRNAISATIKRRARKTFWRLKTRALVPLPKRPKGYNPKLFRKYKRSKRRFSWLRFLRFFYYHPQHFTVNYNTMVAVYRPGVDLRSFMIKYPMIFGPKLSFWREMLRAC